MKLKEGFILHKTGEENIVVPTGKASKSFNGLIRNNATATFIFERLLQDVTEEDLVQAILEKYDVSEEIAKEDVKAVLKQLRKAGILDE